MLQYLHAGAAEAMDPEDPGCEGGNWDKTMKKCFKTAEDHTPSLCLLSNPAHPHWLWRTRLKDSPRRWSITQPGRRFT